MYWTVGTGRSRERDVGRGKQQLHHRAEGRVRVRDLKDFEWVVWRLEAKDPQRLAGEDPDLDERTAKR
jgi:hypothetical protein